jgi:hypothetical protein
MAQPIKTCADCRFNIEGKCHALPPRWTTLPEEDDKYPQVIPTAEACKYYDKGV